MSRRAMKPGPRWLLTVAAVLLPLLSGCGSELARVQGVVTLDGEPLENALVSLFPESGTGTPATALTREDGSFRMGSYTAEDGVRHGAYKVTVTKRDLSQPRVNIEPPSGGGVEVQQEFERQRAAANPQRRARALPKLLVPAKYANAAQTPFRCTVPLTGGNLLLELTSN